MTFSVSSRGPSQHGSFSDSHGASARVHRTDRSPNGPWHVQAVCPGVGWECCMPAGMCFPPRTEELLPAGSGRPCAGQAQGQGEQLSPCDVVSAPTGARTGTGKIPYPRNQGVWSPACTPGPSAFPPTSHRLRASRSHSGLCRKVLGMKHRTHHPVSSGEVLLPCQPSTSAQDSFELSSTSSSISNICHQK